ncbi:MAG: hypothetical protein Q9195_004233 [Heterodermia aff. obscurata]
MASGEDPRPLYGKRLLPKVLDEQAQSNPDKVFAAIARSDVLSDGFRDVTFSQVAQAVNSLAYVLQSTFGPTLNYDFETLTYIGVPDLRYSIVFYAAVKCGYKVWLLEVSNRSGIVFPKLISVKVLLPSPRNPATTNLSLMKQTKSTKILYTSELEAILQNLLASVQDIQCATVGSLDSLLEANGPSFPFGPDFDEAVRQPVVVLHSSGSTGIPKPVVMTHGTFAIADNDRNFPRVPNRENHDLTVWDFHGASGRIYEPFPPFHLAGFFNKIMVPIFTNAIPIFGPPLRSPSGNLTAEIMLQQTVRGCILPPFVAEQLLHESDGLEFFKKLDVFIYAGGPLSQATGNAISSVTTVCQFYGATEVGQIRQLVPRPEDWSYMEFHPDTKLELLPSDDDAYELVLLADPTTESSCALNHNYPGVKEWHTKDLFRPHPTKSGLWKFHGRKDDIIVLSNGEKLNPVPMESHLQTLAIISGALVVGQGRFQPALLLESKDSGEKGSNVIIDEVWPTIESANLLVPGHGRITRSMVLLAPAGKPFIRASKGTIIRKLTETAFQKEIEDLYAGTYQTRSTSNPVLLATAFTSEAIMNLVRSILLPIVHPQLRDTDNLYIHGLDSLKTLEALQALRSSLLQHRTMVQLSWLTVDTFYSNPSIYSLSQIILDFLNHGTVTLKQDRIAKMTTILERFVTSMAPAQIGPASDTKFHGLSVAITGTTGSLGEFLLDQYTSDPRISTIYCLNRSTTAEQQWRSHSSIHNRVDPIKNVALKFITVDLGHKTLGLDHNEYASIAHECDIVVHSAWKIDFNQDVSSFTDVIQSVCTFANWSISSPRQPRLVFISSISSVGSWNSALKDESSIPEEPIDELSAAFAFGYGESKRIAERVLDKASTDFGANISVLRVGQIAGATLSADTKWTQREIIPSLIKTSKAMGIVPNDLPSVDWIPVDTVAKIISDISLDKLQDLSKNGPRYYHVVNPKPVSWLEFLPQMKHHCGPNARAVPLLEWVEKLSTFDPTNLNDLTLYPALRISKFFSIFASSRPTVRYTTSACVEASRTMAELQPVDHSSMDIWLKQCA